MIPAPNNTSAPKSLFYTLLSLPATAMGFALCVQISALSWLLSTKYNLDISQVGYVWLSGPLAGLIGQLLVGVASDQTWFWGGRRRPFIIIGGTIAALMLFCLPHLDKLALVTTGDIANLMAVALLVALVLDLAINISFNPTRSLIADLTAEGDERTIGYTWMQTISGFFGVAAYLISAYLGNYVLIYVGIVLVLLFSIIPTLLIKEPRELKPSQAEAKTTQTTQSGELWKIYIAHGFTWLGVQTMFVFIFAYIMQKISLPNQDAVGHTIGFAFALLNTVGFLLPLLVLTPISQKLGRVKTHAYCLIIMSLAYWGIVFWGNSTVNLYIFMVLAGIGWASVVSIPFAIYSDKINQEKMGWYMGIFNMSVVIPQIIVAGYFGKIIDNAPDKNIIFIIAGTALALSALIWLSVKEK